MRIRHMTTLIYDLLTFQRPLLPSSERILFATDGIKSANKCCDLMNSYRLLVTTSTYEYIQR